MPPLPGVFNSLYKVTRTGIGLYLSPFFLVSGFSNIQFPLTTVLFKAFNVQINYKDLIDNGETFRS